jgi:hypothetical protein
MTIQNAHNKRISKVPAYVQPLPQLSSAPSLIRNSPATPPPPMHRPSDPFSSDLSEMENLDLSSGWKMLEEKEPELLQKVTPTRTPLIAMYSNIQLDLPLSLPSKRKIWSTPPTLPTIQEDFE